MASEIAALEVQILALLGWVDGKFDESEHEASRAILEGTLEGDELRAELATMGTTIPTKADVVAAVQAAPVETSRAALKGGFRLVKADGYLHDAELAVMLELSLAAGLDEADIKRVGAIQDVHQAFIELERLF